MYTRTESDGLHGNRLMIRSQPETEMGTSRSRLMVPEVRCSHDRQGQKMWQKDPIRFRRGLFFFFARIDRSRISCYNRCKYPESTKDRFVPVDHSATVLLSRVHHCHEQSITIRWSLTYD